MFAGSAMKTFRFYLCLFSLLSIAVIARAQFDRGVVIGTVHDASGGATPGVAVTLKSAHTGTSSATTSNKAGDYVFNDVPAGDYTIAAQGSGYKDTPPVAFTVFVGAHQRVDLALIPANVTEQVTVTAGAALLETDSSDRSMVINSTEVVNLPLNGRDPADLALLVPGVNKSALEIEGATSREGAYNVNGLRSQMNTFLLDGLDNNSWSLNDLGFSYQAIQLSPDALSEFRFTTGNQNAEFGQAAGGLMNEVSRSGANQLHGDLWEYLRNTVFNAKGPIPSANGQAPALVQNQFGAAAGGAIRKDKIFYFGDYEGFRRSLRAAQQATLPTAAQAAGKFVDAKGYAIPITNPYTGTVYSTGVIPISALQGSGSQISPLALLVLGYLPTSALSTQASGAGNNYTSFPLGTEDIDKGDGRLDYYISPKMTTFVRYSQRRYDAFDPAPIPAPIYSTAKGFIHTDNRQVAFAWTYQLSNSSALDARMGLTWSNNTQKPSSAGQTNLLTASGMPNAPSDPSYANGLNTVTITGYTQLGRTNSLPTTVNPYVADPKINYTLLRGHHSLKFGYEYIHESQVVSNFKPIFGADTYGGQFSKGKTTATTDPNYISTDTSYQQAWNLADFIFGARSKYELSALHTVEMNQRIHYMYGQDDWRVSNRLTLNLGLRYELGTPPFETNNQLSNYNPVTSPTTSSLVVASAGSIYNRALINRNNLNIAPRVGFAYELDNKTVVRGGYGIGYQQFLRAATVNELAQNAPYNIDNVITQYAPQSKTSPQAVCTSLTVAPTSCFMPTQNGYPNSFLSTSNYSPLSTTTTYDPAHSPTPYVQSFQLSVQREIAPKTFLDLAYVGNHGVHEQILADANQSTPNAAGGSLSLQARRPIPTFGAIQESFNGGPSLYNAFEAKLEKRYANGVYVANSFTWSHAQDLTSANQENTNNQAATNTDGTFVNLYNIMGSFTRSAYDVPLRNATAVVWDLPYGKGRAFGSSSSPVLGLALADWQLTGMYTFSSGLPINLTYTESTAQQVSTIAGFVYRPNLVGNPVLAKGARTQVAAGQYQYLDPSAVSAPTAANTPFGNAPRNVARGPNFNDLDMGLHKRFPLGFDGAGLEFRAEAFDLLNHPNAQTPDSNATDSGYGVISTYFPSRELQLALKLVF
jgi:hypothetical protein